MHDRKKLLFIMNPKAGLMQAPKYMAEIIERFSGAGYLTQVLMTTAGVTRETLQPNTAERSILWWCLAETEP